MACRRPTSRYRSPSASSRSRRHAPTRRVGRASASSRHRTKAKRRSSCSRPARRDGQRSPSRSEHRGDTAPMTSADLVLFSILGGTALLLYGVRLVGEGLQLAAGTRLRHLLSTLTGNRLKALLVGAGVTAVLQSSSATTVMLVGFASAGLLSLKQTIGVILGADIGTTITVQLLAFNLLSLSPLVVFVGWLLWATGRGTAKYVGEAILGFGFLFLGMKLVADGTAPLAQSALFADLLRALTDQPLVLLLVSAAFSGIVRSSAATIGFALSLATAGILPLAGAIPIIFGANIGTAVTALLAAVGQNAEARRVAAAHAAFKVVVVAAIFLPFSDGAAEFFTRLIPERRTSTVGAIYLNPQTLDTPAVALGQALRETLRMGDVVVQSLKDSVTVLEHKDVFAKVIENLELALSALAAQDSSIAEKVIRHKTRINLDERRLRQTHIQRLHEGLRESIDTSSLHLDLLANLKRANSLAAGIAYAVLGRHAVKEEDA